MKNKIKTRKTKTVIEIESFSKLIPVRKACPPSNCTSCDENKTRGEGTALIVRGNKK